MSKSREKTTAVPTPAKRSSGRAYRSRAEREADVNRLVLIVSGVLAGIIVLILAIALGIEGVLLPNQAVASIGNRVITAREFQNRVRYERYKTGLELQPVAQSQFAQQFLTNNQFGPWAEMYQRLQIPTLMGQSVLNEMIDDAAIQQYAAEAGISVSQEEIDQEIFKFFQFDPDPKTATPTLTPTLTLTPLVSATPTATSTPTVEPTITATPTFTPFPTGIPTATPGPTEQFKTFTDNRKAYFDQAAKVVGISESDLRQIFAAQALRQKVRKAVLGDPPKEQEQIRLRRIVVRTEQEAQDVLNALQAGESFSALAKAVSQDTATKESGGLIDWAGRGTRAPEFEDAAWNAEIGAVIGPINVLTAGADQGYNIIQVEGKAVRPLTNDQQTDQQNQRFAEWLNAQREQRNAQTYSTWLDVVPETPTLRELGLPERV